MPLEDIRKPLRHMDISTPIFENSIPLCSRFPSEGSIQLKFNTEYHEYTGLFSFTMYYRSTKDNFIKTPYFIGLLLYAELVHSLPYFHNVGIIIYTDISTYPLLYSLFGNYEKVIFAITLWPSFTIEDTIENSILRCVRYQALEAFPTKWICIRDADTIFPDEIRNIIINYENNNKGHINNVIIEDCIKFLIATIGQWEEVFITKWLGEKDKSMCFGVDVTYRASWHKNSVIYWPALAVGAKFVSRHNNLRKTTKNNLQFNAPLGIYAGFTNFFKERPDDVWPLCFDYITARYSLLRDFRISNDEMATGNKLDHIGKDERMLLFGIMPKYIDNIYFFSILYGKDSNEHALYESLLELVPVITLLGFSTTPDVKTRLLQPKYIDILYNKELKVKKKDLLEFPSSDIWPKFLNLKNNDDLILFSDFYYMIYSNFIKKYKEWYSSYMTMPEAEFNSLITTLKSEPFLVSNSDFNTPPRRILPSRIGGRRVSKKYNKKTKLKTHKKRRTNK